MLRYRYRYAILTGCSAYRMLPYRMLRYRYRYHLLAAARGTRPKAGSSILNANRYRTLKSAIAEIISTMR